MHQKINTIIGVLALSLSAVSVYYQFIHKVDLIRATVHQIERIDKEGIIGFYVSFIFSNSGDRTGTISEMSLIAPTKESHRFLSMPWKDPKTGDGVNPIRVDSGTNIYAEFEFSSMGDFNKLQWDQKKISDKTPKNLGYIPFNLGYVVVDSDGKRQSGRYALLGQWIQEGIPTFTWTPVGEVFDLLPPVGSRRVTDFNRNPDESLSVTFTQGSLE